MSDDTLRVELVAADRLVWSGEATMVIARTTEGDVGILPNHAPMLSLMVDGVVDVQTTDGETWIAAVDAGLPLRGPQPGLGARPSTPRCRTRSTWRRRATSSSAPRSTARTTTRPQAAVRRHEARVRAAEKAS